MIEYNGQTPAAPVTNGINPKTAKAEF
jgi:hypothetical protein